MGLRRLVQDTRPYLHYAISSCGEDQKALEVVLLEKNNSYTLKVTKDNDDLRQWCSKVKRSPDEYMEQLCEALVSEDSNVGVFEVQDGHLVWKQYFPDKEIHSRKGRFKMEKTGYDEAVELVLLGAMQDLQDLTRQVQRLTKETQDNARDMEKAVELASKSVQMKVDLEREIYSKCAALINAKKLRIHQLRSTHPSSSAPRTSCLVRTSDEAGTSSRPTKKPKRQMKARKQEVAKYSDGYSSDTDVDDPDEEDEEDMDTDEERAISLSPVKPNREREKASVTRQGNGEQKAVSESKPSNADDSQDILGASLEAELYAEDTWTAKQGTTTSISPVKPVSQPPPQLTRSKIAEAVTSPTEPKPKNDCDDDEPMSMIYDLF